MLFLMNRERVVSEVLEIVRRMIAQRAKLDLREVEVGCELEGDKVLPTFSIRVKPAGALEAKWYQEIITGCWLAVRPELVRRLAALGEVRYGSTEWWRRQEVCAETPR